MMIEQAIAILEAERVLQAVGAGGPDIGSDSAWLLYVREAGRIVKSDPLFKGEFDDLSLLQEGPCGAGCDGLCKCSD